MLSLADELARVLEQVPEHKVTNEAVDFINRANNMVELWLVESRTKGLQRELDHLKNRAAV